MRVLVPFGTRPEIVKLAPVVRALRAAGIEVVGIATGQHDDPQMTDAFFRDVALTPDRRYALTGSPTERLGGLYAQAADVVAELRPDVVLVLGDTSTVPAYCLAARRSAVPAVHLEAGLRSFNPTSMEEVHRKVAAATCSISLAPTPMAADFLRAEGVEDRRIRVTGNPVIDVLRESGIERRAVGARDGVVLTAHRATNVDDPDRLTEIVLLAGLLADEIGTVTFPVHPRTRARLDEAGLGAGLERDGIVVSPPLTYPDMLRAVSTARVVVTDSGGLQEEAAYFGVPVVVLRRSTPRWEGVESGAAVLTGVDADRAAEAARTFATPAEQERVAALECPYGDGRTGERVAALLLDPSTAELLRLDEPDFVGKPAP